jgi:hypothetical protein
MKYAPGFVSLGNPVEASDSWQEVVVNNFFRFFKPRGRNFMSLAAYQFNVLESMRELHTKVASSSGRLRGRACLWRSSRRSSN